MAEYSNSLIQQVFTPESTLYPAIPKSYISERIILPGEGEALDNCGETKLVIECKNPNCEYPVELIPHDCKRPECPICSDKLLTRIASNSTEKIMACLELSQKHINPNFSLSSVVLSAPDTNSWDYDSIHKEFRRIQRYLGTNHITKVYHAYRFRDRVTGDLLEAVPWKEYQAHKDRYIKVLSPHFHCVIMGKMTKSDTFYKKTGWVVVKLGGYLRESDVFNVLHYALTHAAVSLDRQRKLIDYYGLMRRTKIAYEDIELEQDLCPQCGEQRYVTDYDFYCFYDGAVPEETGMTTLHYKRIITRKWEIVPKRSRRRSS